jgi:glycosyltransferase involved in cell wall biosynthesis
MAICRIKNIPYVVSTIGQLCEWCFQHRIRKKQIYMALIERTNLNNSQALHLTSEKEQQELSKFGLQVPNFILPLGLSLPTLVPGARQQLRQLLGVPDDEPIILAMSRLHPVKGLDYLIPALGQLIDRRFTFVLAGTGAPDYEAEIDTHIVSAGIRDRTYRSGFVSGEMKDLLLQGSDLFALTSHSESFGVAVLEALGSALPVLITPGVALASVVEQHQLGYVSELEVGAIASAVQHFLSDPQTAREMGIQARQLVREKYTWERIASNLSEAYTTILKQDSIPIFY